MKKLKLYWILYRWHRRSMHKLINYLVKRYGRPADDWTSTVLDSNIPNVKCLRLKSITVVNQYNQEHTHNF